MRYGRRGDRREFVQFTAAAVSGLMVARASSVSTHSPGTVQPTAADADLREYLKSQMMTRADVDALLAGRVTNYINRQYDRELGWRFQTGRYKHGIDNSVCSYTFDRSTARRMISHADQRCRVNTYGDSFTFCDQVSDGETWQEILAAHLGEPIRNFGVGRYSVYQAYLRMVREEAGTPARHIVFNIYGDDHYRNLNPLAGGTLGPWGTRPYVTANPASGAFEPKPNPCPAPRALYKMTDLGWIERRFKDDLVTLLRVARASVRANRAERSYGVITELARAHGVNITIDSPDALLATANAIETKAALFASMQIVDSIERFAAARRKSVLYILSFSPREIVEGLKGQLRFDQEFVDFMQQKSLRFVDMLDVHRADFVQFRVAPEDYIRRYYIGHYSPVGNTFQAFALKNKLVEVLNPKPMAYGGAARA